MPENELLLRVAVPSPLYRLFDYRLPAGADPDRARPGVRVLVPFGRRQLVGVLIETTRETEIEGGRLKPALRLLDDAPTFDPALLAFIRDAARYYHHPTGEALATALPVLLRKPGGETRPPDWWRLTGAGAAIDPNSLARAPRQAHVVAALRAHASGLPRDALDAPQAVLRALEDKGWIGRGEAPPARIDEANDAAGTPSPHALNDGQRDAVDAVAAAFGRFQVFLLEGVTGSGKTEVYLRLCAKLAAQGQQALILVPEIGLTPQLVRRIATRLGSSPAVMHSGLNDTQRLAAWQSARRGESPVLVGTRSAIFTPFRRLGLILVDEEHDASFKQQEGFRYSARDLAVWRAQREGIPIVLGSATPSLESLHQAEQGKYARLHLPERAGQAAPPRFHLLDVRGQSLRGQLSPVLAQRMETHLQAGGQLLVFLNRRGYAPALLCHDCGWVAGCPRCDARVTLHQKAHLLRCHHCGHQRRIDARCADCGGANLIATGAGTERMEQVLAEQFPDREVLRIDRDTTRNKGALQSALETARAGTARILLGTQMLAKGHHFPGVTLVVILDADQGLFGADFRSSERMAQLIIQVAGRAGRGAQPGEVIIQTHQPEHPLLRQLVGQGYAAFAAGALAERRAAALPPFASLALLRADATDADKPAAFLDAAQALAQDLATGAVEIWGPVPAPMERRAGRFRAQLMLQSRDRAALQKLLNRWVPALAELDTAKKVRWSIDVDPQEIL